MGTLEVLGLGRAVGLAVLFAGAAISAKAMTLAYVSNAESQEISILELDRAKGELKLLDSVPVGGTVMPMALSPDKSILYAALRSQPYRVASFKIEAPSGKLRKLGEAPLADSMANIDVDGSGKWLFGASYPGHKITVNAIGKDGAPGAIQQLITGIPNAHAVHSDAANRFVLATSLGGDYLSTWRFDAEKGQLTPGNPHITSVAPKSGARHFVWDKDQRFVYLLSELDGALYVYGWDAASGQLRELQRASAVPANFNGTPSAADIHLTPDGSLLFASERASSTISTFRVHPVTGLVQLVGTLPTEKTPRGFAVDSTGRFLLVAGQESHHVALYPIDPITGSIGSPKRIPVGKGPNWIELVDLP